MPSVILVPRHKTVGEVHAPLGIIPSVIRQQRIVPTGLAAVADPGRDAVPRIIQSEIVIAEVVMVIRPADEQMNEQGTGVDRDLGHIAEAGVDPGERHGRKQCSAVGEVIVPKTGGVNAAVRRPVVVVGNPDPAFIGLGPIARPPLVIVLDPEPATGRPEVVPIRRGDVGALLQTFGRRRQVSEFLFLDGGPKAGNPLKPILDFGPIAGKPSLIGRDIPPETADPDKVLFFHFPAPIAGNPLHVLARGRRLGRNFIDGFGRLFLDDQTGFGLTRVRIGEGFVKRSAGQGLIILIELILGLVGPIGRRTEFRGGILGKSEADSHRTRPEKHGNESGNCPVTQHRICPRKGLNERKNMTRRTSRAKHVPSAWRPAGCFAFFPKLPSRMSMANTQWLELGFCCPRGPQRDRFACARLANRMGAKRPTRDPLAIVRMGEF